jgi:hypothetical protein
VVIFLSQILLARWIGGVEFGIYVLRLDLAANGRRHHPSRAAAHRAAHRPRIHPAQRSRRIARLPARQPLDRVSGLRPRSRSLGASPVHALERSLDAGTIMPLYLACVALPFYAVSSMLDGLARPYNAVNIALLPPFVLRPLMLIATMAAALALGIAADATTAMAAFAVATWTTTLVQLILFSRCVAPKCRPGHSATTSALGSSYRARSSRSGCSTCC